MIGGTWVEIDLDIAIWNIPSERMKNGKEHRVPLSASALKVLATMSGVRQSNYLFPGGKRNKPLSNMTFLQLLKRMGRKGLTTHGFRSTFRDWAAERTNYPNEVAEMALAHAIGDKVEAAYRRGDLFDKRRQIMDAWAVYCAKVPDVKSGNIVSIRV